MATVLQRNTVGVRSMCCSVFRAELYWKSFIISPSRLLELIKPWLYIWRLKILFNNHKAVVEIGLTGTTRQSSKFTSILLGKTNQTLLVGHLSEINLKESIYKLCVKVVGKKWPQLWPDGGTRGTVLSENTEGEQELCKYVTSLTQF